MTDWERHSSAVREALNFVVTPTGGLAKRPGTWYLDDALEVVIDNIKRPSFLVKFAFSTGQTYILEFGDFRMRFWIDDHLILNPDNTPYMIATPYAYTDIINATFANYKDTLFVTHWDHPMRRLVRGVAVDHRNWYWDNVLINVGNLPAAPTGVRFVTLGNNGVGYTVTSMRGAAESSGGFTEISTPVIPDEMKITSAPSAATFAQLDTWLNTYKPILGGVSGFPNTSAYDAERARYYAEYATYSRVYNIIHGTSADAYLYEDDPFNTGGFYSANFYDGQLETNEYTYAPVGINSGTIAPVYQALDGDLHGLIVWYPKLVPEPLLGYINRLLLTSGQLWAYAIVRPGAYHPTYRLVISHSSTPSFPFWCVKMHDRSDVVINSQNGLVRSSILRTLAWSVFRYDPAPVINQYILNDLYNRILAFINLRQTRVSNTIAWNAVPEEGITGYRVYRNLIEGDDTALYLIAEVGADVLTYTEEDVSTTVPDYTQSPSVQHENFDEPGKYPHVCTLHQQRLVVASTKEHPLLLAASKPQDYRDFGQSTNPNSPTDSYNFELVAPTSDPIRHLIPLRTLYVLSGAGAFVSTTDGSITRSNVNFNQDAYNGACEIRPVIIDKAAVYVPLNKQMINMLSYSFADDSFVDDNLLFACQALTSNVKITSLDFLRPTISLLFATLSDGNALIGTFITRQKFNAWVRMHTDGYIHQVCACTNAEGYDDMYLVVERDGKFLVERMADARFELGTPSMENSLYLDSALEGAGDVLNGVTELGNLWHLEGKEVWLVADMSAYGPMTVSGGKIAVPEPAQNASRFQVGLPYSAEMETQDLESAGVPTLRSAMRHIYQATVGVLDTLDLKYQLCGGDIYDHVFQLVENFGEIPKAPTIDLQVNSAVDYTNGTRIKIYSDRPLPCTIDSVVAEVEYAG